MYDLVHLHVRTYTCTISVSFVQCRYSKSQTSTVSPMLMYVHILTSLNQFRYTNSVHTLLQGAYIKI